MSCHGNASTAGKTATSVASPARQARCRENCKDAASASARAPDATSTTVGRRSSAATCAATSAFAVSVSPASRSRDAPWRSAEIADSSAGWRLTDASVSETDEQNHSLGVVGCQSISPEALRSLPVPILSTSFVVEYPGTSGIEITRPPAASTSPRPATRPGAQSDPLTRIFGST